MNETRKATRSGARWGPDLAKHQAAAFAATAVDFAVMIALVELATASPPLATAIGAACGAVTNFTLGRTAVFQATQDPVGRQAVRYAFVSGTSLGLNALGVHLLASGGRIHYVLARLITSLLVSVAWNFPLQRHFVFARRARTSGGVREGERLRDLV